MSLLRRMASRIWRAFLTFLSIIGLVEEHRTDEETLLARFRLRYAEFRKLLSANNAFLEKQTEMEERLSSQEFADRAYLKACVVRAVTDVHHMVDSFESISDGRYPALGAKLEQVSRDLTGVLEDRRFALRRDLVIDLSDVTSTDADLVGGKMANLGEMRASLGLPVPDGFAVTVEAFRLFIEENGLGSVLFGEIMSEGAGDGAAAGAAIRERILAAPVPPRIEKEIIAAHERLAGRVGRAPRMAVRSSAPGEDGSLSFAGQFETILNVSREGLCRAYVEVVASLFTPEVLHYRLLHGIPPETASMAVGFVAMVDASTSGMVFSNDPADPEPGRVLIQAVRGLGVALADGRSTPEVIALSRSPQPTILSKTASDQTSRVVCGEEAGVKEEPLTGEDASRTISDDEAVTLARWVWDLEKHFGTPQDVEWARALEGSLVLLQSRPLRIALPSGRPDVVVEGHAVLLEGGQTACPGIGTGTAIHMEEDGDLDSFPEGGVLVASRSSPRFVRIMSRSRAIVTDTGGMTGHMASLSREFRVPTLVGTRGATRSIPPGAGVTVDAGARRVYEGIVDLPDPGVASDIRIEQGGSRPHPTKTSLLVKEIITKVAPLNLTDPRSPHFSVDQCRTLHDLARFIHEKSYEEMFRMGQDLGDMRSSSRYLDIFLPIDLYVIDLGGGIEAPAGARKLKPKHVTSTPFRALLRGMMHEKIPRYGPRPMDLGGFFSIVARHALTSPEAQRTFRDPCYALVSDRYLNYTARVGYHFGVVDSYCGKTLNKNYISMLFRGGASTLERRSRRVRAIAAILNELGFRVSVTRDAVTSRLAKTTEADTVRLLEMVGRLFQFMRQMDVAMVSEDSVEAVKEAFLSEDYGLEGKGKSAG